MTYKTVSTNLYPNNNKIIHMNDTPKIWCNVYSKSEG
jgi:hypothetical protein